MKKTLSLFTLTFLLFVTTQSFAQIKFGAKAGLNLSKMVAKDNDNTLSDDFKTKVGFHLGGTAEYPLSDLLSIETGFFLSTKGYKIEMEQTVGGDKLKISGKMSLYYIEIPITAKVIYEVKDIKIYGLLGPYIGFGLSGKAKSQNTFQGKTTTEESTVNWGSGEGNDLKRVDFGLTIGAGVDLEFIQIGLSYGLGLANLAPVIDNGTKMKNRVFGISVGYKFKLD